MSLFIKRAIALPTIAALSMSMVSCGETKTAQCDRMIEVVNKVVEEVKSTTEKADFNDPNTWTGIAEMTDRATASVKALEFSDEKLKGYKERFVTMYTGIGKASRELVVAAEKKDGAAAQKAATDIQTASSQESSLVNEMNDYCGRKATQ